MQDVPSFKDVNHIFGSGIADPVSKAIYHMVLKEKIEVERHLRQLLQKGFIGPCTSLYGR